MAITLIATVTLLVIAGTFIESATDSHAHAASLTYSHPIFQGILALFFVNILFSSFTRYPYKRKHIPFLITHLGLLLILAGTIAKNAWGLQGSMGIYEGSASRSVLIQNEYALRFEERNSGKVVQIPLRKTLFGKFHPEIDGSSIGLEITLLDASPHSIENRELWIKDNRLHLWGLTPLSLDCDTLVQLHPEFNQKWLVRGEICENPIDRAHEFIRSEGILHLIHSESDQIIKKIPLSEALAGPTQFSGGMVHAEWKFDPTNSVDSIEFTFEHTGTSEKINLPLTGDGAGIPIRQKKYLGKPSISPHLHLQERLLITKNSTGTNQITTINSCGAIHQAKFDPADLSTIVLFHKGFDGYAAIDQLPLSMTLLPGERQAEAIAWQLQEQIKQTIDDEDSLSPPLATLKSVAGDQTPEFFVQFLQQWDRSGEWLFPSGKTLPKELAEIIDRIELTPSETKGALWISLIHQEIAPRITSGESLLAILQDMHWPLLHLLASSAEKDNEGTLLTLLAEQVLLVENDLPMPEIPIPSKAHLYSAILRAYGLHWTELTKPASNDLLQTYVISKKIDLPEEAGEILAPITLNINQESPSKKWEENSPMVVIGVNGPDRTEKISLNWNPKSNSFPQSIQNGKYLLSLSPIEKELPFWLRLRSAKQINYPGSNQPFSYESDLVLVDSKGEKEIKISMNRVHETTDGTRIYMSNLTNKGEGSIHRAGLVVNRDPYKYWITYPGALLVSIGILLLWNQSTRKEKN